MKKIILAGFLLGLINVMPACKTKKKSTSPEALNIQVMDSLALPEGINPLIRYRASLTRKHDLVHTKLEVRFDWNKQYLYGKANITLKPVFYSSDSLVLDAVGMDINELAVLNGSFKVPIKSYSYDKKQLKIKLDRTYSRNEKYTIYIDYVAKPNENVLGGSRAIASDKGLYFINADGKEKNKPTQLWTQGETQASSHWFPTIDSPNQRMTQEISITVDKKFVTLSNGLLLSQTLNNDGTRTDYWKQTLPAAPYLSMMAVSNFAIVKDKWRNLEVNYYVDSAFAPYAKAIFGNTPEMIDFFSKKLGVDYVWEKYAQVVVHDYVSGAMENTSATLHGEYLQRNDKQLLDETNEDVISHELFHQWFGDLVTCESWSNLPLNESFATYGEFLWNEHKYGDDAAAYGGYNDLTNYLAEASRTQSNLIRFNYLDKEDMFDSHSYAKGGRILHMLRKYVGDEAFFESLKLYLSTNKFKTVEVHNLRLAFEEVTGEDLNWFFNQWFLDKGHPRLRISTHYDVNKQIAYLNVDQIQDLDNTPLYKIPLYVDLYASGKVQRYKITVMNRNEEFKFSSAVRPDLINFDAEKMLLCEKKEEKSTREYVFQYKNAPRFLDRYEAIEFLNTTYEDTVLAQQTIVDALNDKFWAIRELAIQSCERFAQKQETKLKPILKEKAINDPKSAVRAASITLLAKYKTDKMLASTFSKAFEDPSPSVSSEGILALKNFNPEEAMTYAKRLEEENNDDLKITVAEVYASAGNEKNNPYFLKLLSESNEYEKYTVLQVYAKFLTLCNSNMVVENLSIFEDAAINEKAWWKRLSATEGLAYLLADASERKTAANIVLLTLKKGTATQAQIDKEQNLLAMAEYQEKEILKVLVKIKKTEKDTNLLDYYKEIPNE